jgi:hypothetical protein
VKGRLSSPLLRPTFGVALVVAAVGFASCGVQRAVVVTSNSPSSSPTHPIALPPEWVSSYAQQCLEKLGRPQLIEWVKTSGTGGAQKILRPITAGATGISGVYGSFDVVWTPEIRYLGAYVLVAHGDFRAVARSGASPVAAKTAILVVEGVEIPDVEGGPAKDVPVSEDLSTYVDEVDLGVEGTQVYGTAVGMTP